MIARCANAALCRKAILDRVRQRAFEFYRADDDPRRSAGTPGVERRARISRPRFRFRRLCLAPRCARRGVRTAIHLDRALEWQHALDRDYADAATGTTSYLTAADAEGLVIRPAATTDEATPNHNAVAAQNLIRLAVLAGDDRWLEKADRLIAAIAPHAAENLYMHMALLNAIDFRLRAAQIVVTGQGPRAEVLLDAARRLPPLDRIVLHAAAADTLPPSHPARDKIAAATAQAFVCVGETCSLPVNDAAGLQAAINAVRRFSTTPSIRGCFVLIACRGAARETHSCETGLSWRLP